MKLSEAKIGTIVYCFLGVGHIVGLGKENNGDYIPIVQFPANRENTATAHWQGILPKFTIIDS